MTKEEKKDIHVMHEENGLGEVQISEEVVATIAGLAATEVEGVASMAGNLTNELIGKLGIKNLSKGSERTGDEPQRGCGFGIAYQI